MRNFLLILSVFWLWTCSGGGEKATGPEEPPIVINLTSLGGQAQKGPFNNGTAINIAELSNTLSPTGRNFSSAISDNTGRFSVANVELESPYVELRANGYYFNEVSNQISSGQLTLFALSNLTGKTSLNVNILTHLEKNRMVALMSGDNPKTFAEAKLQAQEEVLAIFDYSRANVPESELLDISQSGSANAKLLAMSAIIQGDLTVGQMSQLLANMSTDIASDGTLDDTNLRNTLIENSKNLDIAEVRSHLEAHYSSLGVSANIADFETEINQFLKPPVSQDMSASTAEDTAINITLAGSDPEGESLTYTILEVNNATITLSGNVANYAPDANFNGTDTFTYYANDGTTDSNIATVTMTVSAEDDEPNTNNVSTTTDEDVAVAISLTADEYDGQNYSFSIISNPSNGTVSLSGTTATYTPNQDWNGTDTFTFEATDDRIMFGKRNVATATITVNAINDTPTSSEVSGSSDEDTAIDITLSATDVDQDNLTYSIVSDVGNGTSSISGSTLTYTPNQDWNGTDTFTYKVNDGTVDSNTSNGTITIAAVNDAPIANDMTISTNETRFISLDITLDVTDADGDALTYSIESNVSDGTATLNERIVTYVPTTDWNGEDSFTFKANDGTVDSNTATATITVSAVDDPPQVQNISKTINEDTSYTIDFNGFDQGDTEITTYVSDIDNDLSTLQINPTTPSDGEGEMIGSKEFKFTPTANWNGTTTVDYTATVNGATSSTGTITYIVNPVNDAPLTANSEMTIDEDSLDGEFTNIINYATDVDGDSLVYIITKLPFGGNLCQNAGATCGTVLAVGDTVTGENGIENSNPFYMPNENWQGQDTFEWKVNDGVLDSNISQVTVNVNAINDLPVVIDIAKSTNEDSPVTFSVHDYITDPDGDNTYWSYFVETQPANGTVTVEDSNNGNYTYTPNADWNGTDSFTWYIYDDGNGPEPGNSNVATTTITVNSVNDHPVVQDTTGIEVLENRAKEISLIGTDVDDDDSTLSYSVIESPSLGTVTFQQNVATYTPSALGSDSFKFMATDDEGYESNYGTVNLTVVEDTAKTFSTGRWAWANDIIETMDGGFLLAGNDKEMNSGDRGDDQYLVKTNSSGDEEWSRTLGEGQIYSVIETDDGNFAFAGGNPDEAFISKVDTGGNQIWLTEYSNQSYNYDTFSSLKQTTDGGYIVVGASTPSSQSTKHGYVVKLDSSGNEVWTKFFGFSSAPEYLYDVELTSDGGYILGGSSQSVGNGKKDFYLVKIDASGNEEWYKTYGAGESESIRDIKVLDDGGFILLGNTESFTPNWTGNEPYIIKTDSSGNIEWSDTFMKNDNIILRSQAQSLTMSQDGSIVITGQFSYHDDGMSGSTPSDIHITKIDLNGNQLWSKYYGGDSSDVSNAIVLASDGGFAVAGFTSSFGPLRNDNGGRKYNMWLIKTSSDGTKEF